MHTTSDDEKIHRSSSFHSWPIERARKFNNFHCDKIYSWENLLFFKNKIYRIIFVVACIWKNVHNRDKSHIIVCRRNFSKYFFHAVTIWEIWFRARTWLSTFLFSRVDRIKQYSKFALFSAILKSEKIFTTASINSSSPYLISAYNKLSN